MLGSVMKIQRLEQQADKWLPKRKRHAHNAKHIESLLDFIPHLTPRWVRPEHLAPVAALFERAARGEEVRACVSVPPQHGKTELIVHGLVWLLLQHADWPVGYASYNATQARAKSRIARDYAREAGLDLRTDADALHEWLTPQAGGLLARGVGEGLTGQGLHVLIVDDPHKDRAEAESPAMREAVWQWFTSTAMTRVHPGGSVIAVHTRWHPDDLVGRLMGQRDRGEVPWEVVNLPALAEDGAALWPEMRPAGFLLRRKDAIGEYDWASLYMGQPRPRGGAVFHDAFYYDEPPAEGYRVALGVDLAYSKKTSADHSIRVDLAEKDGLLYLLDCRKRQCEAQQFGVTLADGRATYPGAPMRWYAGGTEKGVADLLNTLFPQLELVALPATTDKFVRAQPVAAAWNAGRVRVPRNAPWLPSFLSVVLGFTGQGDAKDDEVDALAAAFDALSDGGGFIRYMASEVA